MERAKISFLPIETEFFPSWNAGRPVKLKLKIEGSNRPYAAKIVIKSAIIKKRGVIVVKGILKGKKNGWPDCLYCKTGSVIHDSGMGWEGLSVSRKTIYTGDRKCTALLNYNHPEQSWLKVK